MKSCREWNPSQAFLLPPSPLEWLPDGHLAYFILDLVEQCVDLGEIESVIEAKDPRGERPYSPGMLVSLLLYGYCTGVFSSRRIARATFEDVAFRVLAGGSQPHFTTINQFRLDHRQALAKLFVQVLRLCRAAGLVKLGHVAIDGTKMDANASKHKAMSYERMLADEQRLTQEIETLFKRAEETDQKEDAQYGKGKTGEDLPEELKRRESRLFRIREAKAALEQEAAQARAEHLRENANEQRTRAENESVGETQRKQAMTRAKNSERKADALTKDDSDNDPPSGSAIADGLPHHRVPSTPDGAPKPTAQRNFTDPDSRIMMKNGAVMQAYNAQIAVDSHSQIIVADAVTNQSPDQEHLVPMLDRVIENCGQAPAAISADNGYCSAANIHESEKRGTDPHLSVGREGKESAPTTSAPTPASAARAAMAAKLKTAAGRALYSRRKVIVEPPFGQIKHARGFRRFSFRGLANVRAEWSFVCLTHNLLKLFRSGWTPMPA